MRPHKKTPPVKQEEVEEEDTPNADDNNNLENPVVQGSPTPGPRDDVVLRPQVPPIMLLLPPSTDSVILTRHNETQVSTTHLLEFSPQRLRNLPVGGSLLVMDRRRGASGQVRNQPSFAPLMPSASDPEPGFSGAVAHNFNRGPPSAPEPMVAPDSTQSGEEGIRHPAADEALPPRQEEVGVGLDGGQRRRVRKFPCLSCSHVDYTRSLVRRHQQVHAGGFFVCRFPGCGVTFRVLATRTKHEKKVHGMHF